MPPPARPARRRSGLRSPHMRAHGSYTDIPLPCCLIRLARVLCRRVGRCVLFFDFSSPASFPPDDQRDARQLPGRRRRARRLHRLGRRRQLQEGPGPGHGPDADGLVRQDVRRDALHHARGQGLDHHRHVHVHRDQRDAPGRHGERRRGTPMRTFRPPARLSLTPPLPARALPPTQTEIPIAEQFVSNFKGDTLVTAPTSHI